MQYIIEVYFSGNGEYIGDAVYADKKSMETYEKENLGYDIIIRNNKFNSSDAKTLNEYIVNKTMVNMEKNNEQYISKKIYVNEYTYFDKNSKKWIIVKDK